MRHTIDQAILRSPLLDLKHRRNILESKISLEKERSTSMMAAIGYRLPWTERQ